MKAEIGQKSPATTLYGQSEENKDFELNPKTQKFLNE